MQGRGGGQSRARSEQELLGWGLGAARICPDPATQCHPHKSLCGPGASCSRWLVVTPLEARAPCGFRAILQEVLDTDLSNEGFPFSTHKLVRAAGHLVRAVRLSFVGELGWELHVPKASCVPVYRAVMAAGAKHGLVNAGYRAIDSLSAEKGYRHWHADLRTDDSPLEAGLAFTCKLRSPVAFLGREALQEQRAAGLRRRLVCFTLEEKVPLFGLEAIWRSGQVVGHVRRADFGFAINKTIAYGYVREPGGGPVSLDFVKSGDYALERSEEQPSRGLRSDRSVPGLGKGAINTSR
uniref:Aminomethyltransferase folate-binding domain-containing protein n=1 Tax=Oryctolagus cuniculus TaxID=9986 RepID=A0A5F9DDY0_RABIT